MEGLIKALGFSGTLAGLAAVVVFFTTLGMGWLKLMRDLGQDKDKRIEQKDRELVDLRREKADLEIKYKTLAVTAAKLENRTVEQGAVLYGKVVYIRRLEKGYNDRNWPLPPRNGPDESP